MISKSTLSAVIVEMFGRKPLINSTKSLIGHTIGASGAIEAAVTVLTLRDQKTHISKNIVNPFRDFPVIRFRRS